MYLIATSFQMKDIYNKVDGIVTNKYQDDAKCSYLNSLNDSPTTRLNSLHHKKRYKGKIIHEFHFRVPFGNIGEIQGFLPEI